MRKLKGFNSFLLTPTVCPFLFEVLLFAPFRVPCGQVVMGSLVNAWGPSEDDRREGPAASSAPVVQAWRVVFEDRDRD